ncbi:MAG: hypothetical protein EA425_06965 [Puniceicoccaceae bacterium]|nr:MAG: hypothetical protein EA425_06965 [Puniceicoccaceae bacterium]
MYPKFPLQIDRRGRTAVTDRNDHLRDLIEQVLFTAPGERINRPDFGCGLLELVFAPNSPELAATTQFLVRGALQQWLGELITIADVSVEHFESGLRIQVDYAVRATGETRSATFSREF